jgi:hypothetical protein
MHDYYYRDENEGEVIIQASGILLSVRVSEEDEGAPHASALVLLPVEEIDRMIAGLQAAKHKIIAYKTRYR